MPSAVEQMRSVESSADFLRAKTLLKDREYDEACEVLSRLLEKLVEEHGDFGAPLAPLYYEYGNALLLLVESNSNVFGESVKKKEEVEVEVNEQAMEEVKEEQEEQEDSAEIGQEEGGEEAPEGISVDDILVQLIEEYKKTNGEDPTDEVLEQWKATLASANLSALGESLAGEGNEGGSASSKTGEVEEKGERREEGAGEVKEEKDAAKPGMSNDDLEENMNIAWEVLETGRVIVTRELETTTDEGDLKYLRQLLGNAFLRLADLSMERGLFEQSIVDYQNCLGKFQQVFDRTSFDLADVYLHLASAHVFSSSATDSLAKVREHQLNALIAYVEAIYTLVADRHNAVKDAAVIEPIIANLKLEDVVNEEEDEDEEGQNAGKGKAKEKSQEGNGEDPPLSKAEQKILDRVKGEVQRILKCLPTEDQLKADSSKETEDSLKRLGMVEEVMMKVDDIVIVLENEEAAQAIRGGSSGLVEEALEIASGQQLNKNSESSSAGPTNLLQVRKKAEPEGTGSDQTASQVEPNLVAVKRKGDVPAKEESESNKRAKA